MSRDLGAEAMAAFNDRDWERFYSLAGEELSVRTDRRWPGGGQFQGRDEITRFLGQFLEPWAEIRYRRTTAPERQGDRWLERGRWEGSGASTGIPGTIDFSLVFSVSGDRIQRLDFFIDHEDAVEFHSAAGAGAGG